MKNWQRDQIPRTWREIGGEEAQDGKDCMERDLERMEGEQQQNIEGVGDCC